MLSFFSKKIKVAVHDGMFHPDEVFSVAVLSLYLKRPLKIFRTRDQKILSKMDYLFDVGGEYDPQKHKFDHHQNGWDFKRANGIPYASSGLAWKEFGEKITGSIEVANKIDEKIMQPMDAEDNTLEICKNTFENVSPYSVSDYIFSFNPVWTEKGADSLKYFEIAVEEAKKVLIREIKKAHGSILGKKRIEKIYNETSDKRILVLDESYTWRKFVSLYPEPLFVIKPNKDWYINAVNVAGLKFKNKLDFPDSWAGKSGKDLVKVTGVKDAIFCHNNRSVATARSKEGAIELARRAIANSKFQVSS